jgi:hypothetical protein
MTLNRSLSLSLLLVLTGLPLLAESSPAAKTGADRSAPKAAGGQQGGQAQPAELSNDGVEKVVHEAKIFSSEFPLHAIIKVPEVEILTVRHPKATDQDCKIDSVLVAKLLFDKYPKQLTRMKLILSDDKSASTEEIMVTTGDVRAYGSGSISQDELLSSLELKNSDGEQSVVEIGPFARARRLLSGRIDQLKRNGTDTKPYEEILSKIETAASGKLDGAGRALLKQDITDLNRHLSDQEEMIRQARNIAHGYGPNSGKANRLSNSFKSQSGAAEGNFAHVGQRFQLGQSIRNALLQMQNQGKDPSQYYKELQRVRELRSNNHGDDADQAMNALARSLGIDPNKPGSQ